MTKTNGLPQFLYPPESRSSLRILLILLFLSVSIPSPAQFASSRVEKAVADFTADTQMRYAIASLTILDQRSGNIVYSLNPDIGLAPASCQKTLTAAAAFYLLGTDFRYQTRLFHTGSVQNGVLKGDLIIGGSGDPTLGSPRYTSSKRELILQQWMNAVKTAGIQKIEGRIIGDASSFDTQMPPDGWIWQDIGNYYGAGTSALCWNENQYELQLLPGDQPGDPVTIAGTTPPLRQLRFINELQTGPAGSGDQTYIYTAPYSHTAYLRGTAPQDKKRFRVSGAVADPALLCAGELRNALEQANITVSAPSTTTRLLQLDGKNPDGPKKILTTYASPPLDSIVFWFLRRSINLYGEQLVKTLALQQNIPVSTNAGIHIEKEFWKSKGVDPGAINIIDGSGLSPGNRITSYSMAHILYLVTREQWYNTYYNCLPVIHHTRMKSGHINNVCAYAGYLTASDGAPLVFSFIVNNYTGSTGAMNAKMFKVIDEMKK